MDRQRQKELQKRTKRGTCAHLIHQREEIEKAQAKQKAKDEKKALLEAEEAELSKSSGWLNLVEKGQPQVPKKTKYEIDKYKQKLEEEMEEKHPDPLAPPENYGKEDDDDFEKELEVNWNHLWREQYEKDMEQ